MNELQLQVGPYRTTFIGIELLRQDTKKEWQNYLEILKRVDEAKQWAIGDALVLGKRHYGDDVYKEAEKILGIKENELSRLMRTSNQFEIRLRRLNLGWWHHYEVASIKKVEEIMKVDKKTGELIPTGKLQLSEEPDMEKIQELLEIAEKNKTSVRDLREDIRRYKRQQDGQIRLANTPEKYSLLYADPPWFYGDKLIDGYGAAEHHYPPMSIKELCSLPIRNVSADNAALFLWVTSPILDECWPVIQAWGFEYKASFVWDKVKHNYGHYNSVRHELLLICTKGSFLPEATELTDSVQSIERSEKHSEKPEEFRKIIESMYPNSKKIELFARNKAEGWDVFGDEAGL